MNWGEFWTAVSDWAITWIPVLGPLGILTTALIAYFAYRQKLEADRRAQWWIRTQWALEASLSANPRRALAGLAVLNDLKTSSLATREDRELFRLIGLTVQEDLGDDAGQPAAQHSLRGATNGPGLAARILEQAQALLAGPDPAGPGPAMPGLAGPDLAGPDLAGPGPAVPEEGSGAESLPGRGAPGAGY